MTKPTAKTLLTDPANVAQMSDDALSPILERIEQRNEVYKMPDVPALIKALRYACERIGFMSDLWCGMNNMNGRNALADIASILSTAPLSTGQEELHEIARDLAQHFVMWKPEQDPDNEAQNRAYLYILRVLSGCKYCSAMTRLHLEAMQSTEEVLTPEAKRNERTKTV